MKNIHIPDSYRIWRPITMRLRITKKCIERYGLGHPVAQLRRSYLSMYIEWWLHNIGYYITKPFIFIEALDCINKRCKDVDIEERHHK